MKPNCIQRFALSLLALVVFASCATTIKGPDGKERFRTTADASNVTYRDNDVEFHADTLNHSTPTRAGFNGFTSTVTAAGAAFATGGVR